MRPAGIAVALVALWAAPLAPPLEGQQPPAPPPDTVTLSPEEAHRARQRALLERLSRAPGQDTLDPRPPDDAVPPSGLARPGLRPPSSGAGADAGMAGDTVVEALLARLVGYQPVQYQAGRARFEAVTRDLFLYADSAERVSVRYDDQQITADSLIRFNQMEDRVVADGTPEFTPREGQPVTSRRILVDTRSQQASAFGAQTEYTEGATWYVFGDLPRIGMDMVFASHARFTSCDLDVPHYHFASDRIKIIRGNILVAMPVRLYFGDVPVFWLPFVAQSLSTGRASGLLTPRFSVNDVVRTAGGYQRRLSNVGFYWAMNDYMDATVAMDWFSGNYTALTGGLRYRWLGRFLQGSVNARQFWRDEGGTEFSLTGQHSWELSERTNMNASVAYVSSADFVRRSTFDPLEATQQITSSGGLTRRFDWGTLNVLGNRAQSLSDDRVDVTFPRATLSLKTVTLFPAPPNQAGAFNNMTWSGSANLRRSTRTFPEQPLDGPFLFHRADQGLTNLSMSHSLGVGSLSLGQELRFQETGLRGVPGDTLPYLPSTLDPGARVNIGDATVDWGTSLSYQQSLIGATSITPSISLTGSALRSDTLELAQSFVSGPPRLHFGASLRSHLYGFFPGFGPFEAMRHRISPSVSYRWAPEVEPTTLQRQVFGALTLQPQSVLTLNFSQTFEAKRRASEGDAPAAPGAPAGPAEAGEPGAGDPVEPDLPGVEPGGVEAELGDEPDDRPLGPLDPRGEPTRRPQGQVVNLLSLHTSAISYDFVQADSAGHFLQGFTMTRLRNEIGSDYLRGLSLSVEHDLFRDSLVAGVRERSFAPHLSAVNLRFSVNARSPIFRWLGGGDRGDEVAEEAPGDPEDEFGMRSMTDEASILPGRASPAQMREARQSGSARRDWSAGITYALTRPRQLSAFREPAQTLRLAVTASPTDRWRMAWRTSYDLQSHDFSDHIVTLTRDLHRWQANFDFLKTTTGNWAFRFEVSLTDNHDLRFEHEQRSIEPSIPPLP